MNDQKGKNMSSAKKEAVGPDGLTKKERRALKVQTKPKPPHENNTVHPPINKISTTHPAQIKTQSATEKVTNQSKQSNDKKDEASKPVNKTNDKPISQLSEKELRKLEWEKKLQEKKQQQPVAIEKEAGLSKAELKAKRREQQESQRLAKASTINDQILQTVKEKESSKPERKKSPSPKTPLKKSPVSKAVKKVSTDHRVQLVQHLYIEPSDKSDSEGVIVNFKNVHPAFVRLGTQYSTKTILGSNSRCLALLSALKQLIDDIQTPPKQEFCRYLESILQSCTNYLQQCRPLAVSMTNALRHFKLQLSQVKTNLSDNEKRAALQNYIDVYIQDDITKAGQAIQIKVNEKIKDGDVILTYGCSSLIRQIFLYALRKGKQFKVIVVDGRPHLEGREMLRRLVEADIECKYVLINAVSYIMSSVSKVLLGAHALLTNGYVMSRIGTAQVALVAQAYNKPVLVCCETYKFSERVQTDSFVYNEIDEEDKLTQVDTLKEKSPLIGWRGNNKLTPLNLLYDVTPPDLVTAVVTELAILPCTSVPVILRINANEAI